MNNTHNLKWIAVATLGFVGSFAERAEAAPVMQTFGPVEMSDSRNYDVTGNANPDLDLTMDFLLPQFDPSLGTLLAVDVTFAGVSRGRDGTLTNNNSTAVNLDVFEASAGTVSAPGIISGGGTGFGFALTVSGGDTVSLAPPDPLIELAFGTFGTYAVSSVDFGDYIGVSTFAAQIVAQPVLDISGITGGDASNVQWMGSVSATTSVSVTYTYESAAPTPEPTTFVLATLGLIGLGATRRSRRPVARGPHLPSVDVTAAS